MASKGYDDSPPRNGVIFFYAILTVIFLFGVSKLLSSYFARMMEGEMQEKVYTVGLDTAVEAKARDQEALQKSGIDNAKRLYAQRGRSASTAIANESGAGKPAITGWSQLKRDVAAPVAPAAPEAVPVPSAPPNDPVPIPEGPRPGGVTAPPRGGSTSPSTPGASTTPSANRGVSPAPQPVTPATHNN